MAACEHLAAAGGGAAPEPETTAGCADCLAEGLEIWAHLRMCTDCGHVACCDSSPKRHATAHFRNSGHPVVRSFEPGESWAWCYVDERLG